MQALRIRYEGRYLGSCWDEKRFKGEVLLLLFNSMRNKNIFRYDLINWEMNLIDLIDELGEYDFEFLC